MNDNFSDECELDEDYLSNDEFEEDSFAQDEDEVTKGHLFSDTLYISLGNPKSVELVPLAFTLPDEISPVIEAGFTLAWTKPCLLTLADIQKATHSDGRSFKNLPYASLRGFLEVILKNAVHCFACRIAAL